MDQLAIIRVFAALGLVLFCIILFGMVARKTGLLGKIRRNSALPVISRTPLGPRTEVVVVQAGNEQLVLGVTAQQINLLHKMPAPETPPENETHDSDTTGHSSSAKVPATSASPEGKMTFRDTLKRHLPIKMLLVCLLPALLLMADPAFAQVAMPALTSASNPDGSQTYSLSMQTLLLLTGLSFLPAVILMMTGFTRIVIVLGLLRNALGTGASPPNSVIIGLSLFLTFFVMSPVLDQIAEDAYAPLNAGQITFEQAVERASRPIHAFMIGQTRESDLALFADMANINEFESPEAVPMRILIPAFVTSELKTAFQIGFTIFIPFLIIDLVIASVLMSLGMMMVPPVTISLPFKLMLFVLADGWHLLLGSLARSFYQ
ncbi:flagellar type III secretion system pore protein FliP [Advenella alkanexedens]|jgi:flagellar biosynthetic protein FliP|uniref:Flagellar biosynthetic protein FliP n=2 Tax=Advenella TaxID=290425 RepID=A0ABS6NPV0_9BURK|nr:MULTISPECIES: flagellar type III secretion system pore protein FliP [Advenella]MBV4397659.1 flagellar type III secretion system pore protein FliP [Advenella alkanexedens]MDD3759037.1 flagellar type III secretion system pore protein FliP [Advenella sp.]NLN68301.1 flagellar type III secretion system pore protein FliP [Alcaligenaceae bacterium]